MFQENKNIFLKIQMSKITSQGRPKLTLVIERELVHSTWYDANRESIQI